MSKMTILINHDIRMLTKSFKWSIGEAENNKQSSFSTKSCFQILPFYVLTSHVT